jgi:hypothetical protein
MGARELLTIYSEIGVHVSLLDDAVSAGFSAATAEVGSIPAEVFAHHGHMSRFTIRFAYADQIPYGIVTDPELDWLLRGYSPAIIWGDPIKRCDLATEWARGRQCAFDGGHWPAMSACPDASAILAHVAAFLRAMVGFGAIAQSRHFRNAQWRYRFHDHAYAGLTRDQAIESDHVW